MMASYSGGIQATGFGQTHPLNVCCTALLTSYVMEVGKFAFAARLSPNSRRTCTSYLIYEKRKIKNIL